ncbi:chorismate synthase [Streptococcus agalactiae 515]|nr:chorismate synthase [Streptococcus agalactiae 515]
MPSTKSPMIISFVFLLLISSIKILKGIRLPAAGVVMEAVVATVLVTEVLEKFSSDNMYELKEAVKLYRNYVNHF